MTIVCPDADVREIRVEHPETNTPRITIIFNDNRPDQQLTQPELHARASEIDKDKPVPERDRAITMGALFFILWNHQDQYRDVCAAISERIARQNICSTGAQADISADRDQRLRGAYDGLQKRPDGSFVISRDTIPDGVHLNEQDIPKLTA